MEAVRRILAEDPEISPADGARAVQAHYGLRMAANTFRAYKSSMKRLAANRANPAHLSAPVDGADPLAAARQVKALVEQFGAETVKGLADLFGPG
jgi:hypothetical protein